MKTIELLFLIIQLYFIMSCNNVFGNKNKKKTSNFRSKSFPMNKTIEYLVKGNLTTEFLDIALYILEHDTCMKFVKISDTSSKNAIHIKKGEKCSANAEIKQGKIWYSIIVNQNCIDIFYFMRLINLSILMRYQLTKCLARKKGLRQSHIKKKTFPSLIKKYKCEIKPLNEAIAIVNKYTLVYSTLNIKKRKNIEPKNLKQVDYNRLYLFADARKIETIMCKDKCKNKCKIKCENGGYLDTKLCDRCRCSKFYSGKTCKNYKSLSGDLSCGKIILKASSKKKFTQINLSTQCFYFIEPSSKNKTIKVTFKVSKPISWDCDLYPILEVKYRKDKSKTGVIPCGKIKNFSVTSSKGTTVMIGQSFIFLDGYTMTIEYKEF